MAVGNTLCWRGDLASSSIKHYAAFPNHHDDMIHAESARQLTIIRKIHQDYVGILAVFKRPTSRAYSARMRGIDSCRGDGFLGAQAEAQHGKRNRHLQIE